MEQYASLVRPQGSQVLMLHGIWWDHGKGISALLLLIHLEQVTGSPLFGEAGVQFLVEKWLLEQYASLVRPQGSQVLGFDAAWYLVGSWKRCISIAVTHSFGTSHRFTPFWRGWRTVFDREMAIPTIRFSC